MGRTGLPRTRHIRHRRFERISRQPNLTSFYTDEATDLQATGATTDFTAANATNLFTATAHGFVEGQGPMKVSNSGGSLPTGLATDARYWVIPTTVNTFQLCESLEAYRVGAVVEISDDGTGTQSIAFASDTASDIYNINRQGTRPVVIANATDVDDI